MNWGLLFAIFIAVCIGWAYFGWLQEESRRKRELEDAKLKYYKSNTKEDE
jgi:hypothetical protein